VPLFSGSVLAVWALVCFGVYGCTPAATGLARRGRWYRGRRLRELTPLNSTSPALPRERRAWFGFGLCFVCSSIGLWGWGGGGGLVLGRWLISFTLMGAVIAVLVWARSCFPLRQFLDLPGWPLAIVGLGNPIVIAPRWFPGSPAAM